MNHARPTALLAAISCALVAARAQDQRVRFVASAPMVHIAVHDLPALLAALPGTKLGQLLAEPDVTAALAAGQRVHVGKRERWTRAYDALSALAKTSFRCHPEGIKLSPQGEEVTMQLLMIKALAWQRLAADRDGTVHEGHGDFATRTIGELTGARPARGEGKVP